MLIKNPLTDANWDQKLKGLPDATFFHGSAWARVLHDTYGFTPNYFVTESGNKITGLLPVMEVDSWLTGRRGVSLPFTDACAPLCRDSASFQPLWEAALDRAKLQKWKYLELRGGRELLSGSRPAVSFWGHTLDLRRPAETVFAGFDSAVRRAIRKAEQSELTVEVANSQKAVEDFYRLLCLTRKRLGVPAQPYRFFEAIYRHIIGPQKGCVVLARKSKVPVAGALFFHHETTALYKFAASDVSYQNLRPNNLVIWHAIQWHLERNFESFDFGRTSLHNEGLRQFKQSWDAEEQVLEYARYDSRRNEFDTQVDKSSGWHNRIFQVLPLAVSRLIGLALYKHTA